MPIVNQVSNKKTIKKEKSPTPAFSPFIIATINFNMSFFSLSINDIYYIHILFIYILIILRFRWVWIARLEHGADVSHLVQMSAICLSERSLTTALGSDRPIGHLVCAYFICSMFLLQKSLIFFLQNCHTFFAIIIHLGRHVISLIKQTSLINFWLFVHLT